jgi:hypothetical protein
MSPAARSPSRGGIPRSEEEIKDILKYIEHPKIKPAYHSFALMEKGWLAAAVDFLSGGFSLFDLFDEGGRYIGQCKTDFPTDYWFFFKNGKTYAVATDDEGYKYEKY